MPQDAVGAAGHIRAMFAILGFPLTKYLLVFAFFGLLDELLRPEGRRALAARLPVTEAGRKGGLLPALAVLFDRLVGPHPLSRRHLLSVLLLTLGAYLVLLSGWLAWSPAGAPVLAAGQEDVRAAMAGQMARFWVFFGLPATALSLAVCRVVIGALGRGRLGPRLRLPALVAGDVALTLAVTWALYFGVMLFVQPMGGGQSLPETFALTNLTFVYAIGFTSLSGVYVFAAFVSTALVLAVAGLAALAPRLRVPARFAAQPMTLAALPVLAVLLAVDLLRALL